MLLRMNPHALDPQAEVERIAGEVRAGLARKYQTRSQLAEARAQLAEVLGLSLGTVRSRLAGKTPFTILELAQISIWLGIPVERLVVRSVA